MATTKMPEFSNLTLDRTDNIFTITMRKPPENRISRAFAQEIISALHYIQDTLGPGAEGAVITRGSDEKFWCTGLDLDEAERDPFANSSGFYPLLATMLDFPFPTVALLTGHTFGGACPFALSHDYRVMNSKRGFFSMPPVDLGLSFPGIGALPRMKLSPKIARTMILEAKKWTSEQALEDGIVDAIAPPDQMYNKALELARQWAPKAKAGVYALLRNELYGEMSQKIRSVAWVRGWETTRKGFSKI